MPIKIRGILLKGKKIGLIKEDKRIFSLDLSDTSKYAIVCEECIDLIGPQEEKIPVPYIINSEIYPPRAGFYLIVFSKCDKYESHDPSSFIYRYIVLNDITNRNILFTNFNQLVELINSRKAIIIKRLDLLLAKVVAKGYVPKSWLNIIESEKNH